jgi:hypothetical protein
MIKQTYIQTFNPVPSYNSSLLLCAALLSKSLSHKERGYFAESVKMELPNIVHLDSQIDSL